MGGWTGNGKDGISWDGKLDSKAGEIQHTPENDLDIVNKVYVNGNFVPYTGATQTIDLGSQNLETTGALWGGDLAITGSFVLGSNLQARILSAGNDLWLTGGASKTIIISSSGMDFGDGDIITTGDVGIGTTDPLGKLQINTPVSENVTDASDTMNIFGSVASRDFSLAIYDKDGTFNTLGIGGGILLGGQYGSGYYELGAGLKAVRESTGGFIDDWGMAFYTSFDNNLLNEVMRIDKDGNVGINKTDPSVKLDVVGDAAFTGDVTCNDITLTSPTAGNVKIRDFPHGDFGGLLFEPQANGIQAWLNMMTKEGDGNTRLQFRMWAKGTVGDITNSEYFRFFYNISPRRFQIETSATGTGTLLPLHIFTGTNTNQAVWNTNGSLTFGTGSVNITGGDLSLSRNLTFTGGGSGLSHGFVEGDHINWTQASATQNTWYNISDANMNTRFLNRIVHDGNGKMTIEQDGLYWVYFNAAYEVNAANVHMELGIEVNGSGSANVTGPHTHTESKFANQEEDHGSGALMELSEDDTIEVAIRTIDSGNPNFIVDNVHLTCYQIAG